MNRRVLVALACLASAAAGAWFGRGTAPARVETTTTTASSSDSTVQAHVAEKRTEAPTRRVARRILVPCPPAASALPAQQVVEEVVEERGPVVVERVEDAATTLHLATATTSKHVETSQPRLMLGATIGAQFSFAPVPTYGAELKYRFAGPLWVGIAATTAREVRASLSVTF